VLAKAGRLDEAESVYKRMLESQPHEATFWLWYARFLIQDRPQQQKKAQRAIDKAEEYSTPRTIPRTAIEELRAKIDVE
jgi:predicted Zn-dependent protease